MKVFLAVGHGLKPDGGFDPGATGGGWSEQDAGDVIVAEAASRLRAAGAEVRDEAHRDDPNFVGTTRDANGWGADWVVTVHHDWSGAPEGAFGHWISSAGKELADAIQRTVGEAGFPLRDDWHKRRTDLYVLKHTQAPCVLYEAGRIGQKGLDTEEGLKAMGRAIAKGIARHVGLDEEGEMASEQEIRDMIDARIAEAFDLGNAGDGRHITETHRELTRLLEAADLGRLGDLQYVVETHRKLRDAGLIDVAELLVGLLDDES